MLNAETNGLDTLFINTSNIENLYQASNLLNEKIIESSNNLKNYINFIDATSNLHDIRETSNSLISYTNNKILENLTVNEVTSNKLNDEIIITSNNLIGYVNRESTKSTNILLYELFLDKSELKNIIIGSNISLSNNLVNVIKSEDNKVKNIIRSTSNQLNNKIETNVNSLINNITN